jgi:hypothetical protein
LADASATTHHIEQRIVTLTLEAQEDFLENDDFIEPFDMPVTSQELDPGTISNLDERILVEEMIANTDEDEDEDEEDTCHIQFERDQLQLKINWEPPVRFLLLVPPYLTENRRRVFRATPPSFKSSKNASDLSPSSRMTSPGAL